MTKYITDLDGKRIEVTNLRKAIKQAAAFKEYRHIGTTFRQLDKKLCAYWTDLHEKLLQLQSRLDNIKKLQQ